jgi:hypothetical protein
MSNGTNVLMFQGPVGLLSAARIDAVVMILVAVLMILVALVTAEITTLLTQNNNFIRSLNKLCI